MNRLEDLAAFGVPFATAGRVRQRGASHAHRKRFIGIGIMSDPSGEPDEEVEVWAFRRFDARAGQVVTSFGKAEMDAIEGFHAEAIPGSMESVPRHRLDGNGIYTPPEVMMSPAARLRLERLRAQYAGLLADEDHGRLEGWADRVATLSIILAQIEEKLELGTSRL